MELSEAFKKELVTVVAESCGIDDIPSDLEYADPIIGPESPFGLDSLDAIEIVVAIQHKYDVRIEQMDTAQRVLASIDVLAQFIQERKGCTQ